MAIKMPPRRPAAPATAEDFIAGASAAPAPRLDLPWTDPKVRPDLRVQMNVKVAEPLALKCHYLALRLGLRKQEVMERALSEWTEEQLRKLGLPT
ncbi:hypothetical protein [Roseomonas sp. USHLN139]|uniref:hypothetical protein n=1 Tax=Roseomonas sp. USHLN139 TaxID=3081298 RepID=UPI003B0186A6